MVVTGDTSPTTQPQPQDPPQLIPPSPFYVGPSSGPLCFGHREKNPYSKDLARRFRLALMIVEPISDWSRLMSHPVNGVI